MIWNKDIIDTDPERNSTSFMYFHFIYGHNESFILTDPVSNTKIVLFECNLN